MRHVFAAVCLVAAAALAIPASAQEGHPLDGTWHGEYGSGAQKSRVVLYMHWENRMIRGVINPGPNAVPITIATLEPKGWKLHLEAEMKDAKGVATPVAIDAEIGDIGSYNRTLTGTWTQGGAKSEFKAKRD